MGSGSVSKGERVKEGKSQEAGRERGRESACKWSWMQVRECAVKASEKGLRGCSQILSIEEAFSANQ